MIDNVKEYIKPVVEEIRKVISPKAKSQRIMLWISRVLLTILLVVGWILLRRNHVTTIH